MYCFSLGPQLYDADRNGRPLGLVDCVRVTYGVGLARIFRINPDGTLTLVVDRAGSAYEIVHAPSGRRIRRRARRLRYRDELPGGRP